MATRPWSSAAPGAGKAHTSEAGLTGNVTLTMLNISNPLDPTMIGSTVVTQDTFPNAGDNPAGKLQAVYLGNGLFAVSETLGSDGVPVLLVVNASNPSSLATNTVAASADVNGMAVSGDRLLATSGAGLEIYQTGALTTESVTAAGNRADDRRRGHGAELVQRAAQSGSPWQWHGDAGVGFDARARRGQSTDYLANNGDRSRIRSSRRGGHGREYPGWQ